MTVKLFCLLVLTFFGMIVRFVADRDSSWRVVQKSTENPKYLCNSFLFWRTSAPAYSCSVGSQTGRSISNHNTCPGNNFLKGGVFFPDAPVRWGLLRFIILQVLVIVVISTCMASTPPVQPSLTLNVSNNLPVRIPPSRFWLRGTAMSHIPNLLTIVS